MLLESSGQRNSPPAKAGSLLTTALPDVQPFPRQARDTVGKGGNPQNKTQPQSEQTVPCNPKSLLLTVQECGTKAEPVHRFKVKHRESGSV